VLALQYTGRLKLCEQLHKLNGKKVIAIQKLNAQYSKEQLKKFYFARMRNSVHLIFVWLLLYYQ
jgi:hypothetical protein